MLNIDLLDIFNDIRKKCWKVTYFGYDDGIGYRHYFDKKSKQKILNKYNKDIKFSNQKQKAQIISNHFKTKQKNNKKGKNYFKNINQKKLVIVYKKQLML
ncbi:hypothetical protein [Spiroplasma endosymbiont of Polydrusus pterygomalis]|uniref:hypothetical protein n=1 Tax=Spiroplasma endosymbiont of Polydrusus pterygomalis TaxID=3139327 RepID=UPI003CCA6E98